MDLLTFVANLDEHIANYKGLTEANAKEIVEYVKSGLEDYKLKVTYEHLSVLETIKAIRETKSPDLPRPQFKMFITASRARSDFNVPIVRQANGAIVAIEDAVEYDETRLRARIMLVPTNEFNIKFKYEDILNNINKDLYDVYAIHDGTLVNLYYDKNHVTAAGVGSWLFATKKCFNVSGVEWRGTQYDVVIQELIRDYKLDLSKLSKVKTYTIGFKHPAFHPFGQPAEWAPGKRENWIQSAWFIQAHNNLTGEVVLDNDEMPIPEQEKVKLPLSVFRDLKLTLKNYINDPDKAPNFGYILRSRDPSKTGTMCDVLLESSLWREIRKHIYQVPFIEDREVRTVHEQHFKDMNYVILESYLDFTKYKIFLSLFQQYKPYYERFDKFITSMVDMIHVELLHDFEIKKKFEKTTLPEVAKQLYADVKQQYQLTASAKPKPRGKSVPKIWIDRKTIKNMILNLKYTELYYLELFKPEVKA